MSVIPKLGRNLGSFLRGWQHLPHVREDVIARLAPRPKLSDSQWKAEFYPGQDIPDDFIHWFRQSISKWWELDLAGAIPSDRLAEDLGLGMATWNDTYLDVLEDFMDTYDITMPESRELIDAPIANLDDMLQLFWRHVLLHAKDKSSKIPQVTSL